MFGLFHFRILLFCFHFRFLSNFNRILRLQDKQAVRFQFEESVSTFTAGRFTLSPGNTQPVLVYVTLSNKIQIYYNLCLGTDLTLSSLIHYPPMLREAGDTLKLLGKTRTIFFYLHISLINKVTVLDACLYWRFLWLGIVCILSTFQTVLGK